MSVQENQSNLLSTRMAGFTACFLTVVLWSGNTIVTKASAGEISPTSISFYRWFVALLIVLPITGPAAWRERRECLRYWKKIVVLAALSMVIYQGLAYKAAETTSAVNMGVMLALMPLFSSILAAAIMAQPLTRSSFAGGIISFVGLIFLTSKGNPSILLQNGLHLGDGLMLIAVVSNALFGVLVKRWNIPISLQALIFCQIACATLMLFPLFLMGPISPITPTNIPMILYAAIAASLLAPMLWILGIKQLGPFQSSLFINLVPIMVAVLAWKLLDEKFETYHLIGGAVTLVGVAVGLRSRH